MTSTIHLFTQGRHPPAKTADVGGGLKVLGWVRDSQANRYTLMLAPGRLFKPTRYPKRFTTDAFACVRR